MGQAGQVPHRCRKRENHEKQWTETVAVGGVGFLKEIRDDLGVRVLGRSIVPDGEQHQLREAQFF